MKLFNNDFKLALKGYKAVKTVCKGAKFVIAEGEIVTQSTDVELSAAVDTIGYESTLLLGDNILLDETTLALLEKCKNEKEFDITTTEIKAGTKTITYTCDDVANEFIDTSDYKEVARIEQCELLTCIKGVKFSTAKDDARPVLTNILWEGNSFVTVDGFRITTKSSSATIDMPILLTPTAYSLLEKLLDKKSDQLVSVYLDLDHSDKRYISFEFGDIILTCLVGEGEFMNYKQVFTDDITAKLSVNRVELLNKLEFLQQDKSPVLINVDDVMALTTESITNKLSDTVTYELLDGGFKEPLEMAFNPKYFIELLKNISSDTVVLNFTGGRLSPIIVEHDTGKDLLLPIRLNK